MVRKLRKVQEPLRRNAEKGSTTLVPQRPALGLRRFINLSLSNAGQPFPQGTGGAGRGAAALRRGRIRIRKGKAMRVMTAMATMAFGTMIAPQMLQAQNPACAPRDTVLRKLADTYGETRQGIGLNGDNALIEVFASDETGSWTITITSSAGLTCLLASGQSYETLSEPLPSTDSDA